MIVINVRLANELLDRVRTRVRGLDFINIYDDLRRRAKKLHAVVASIPLNIHHSSSSSPQQAIIIYSQPLALVATINNERTPTSNNFEATATHYYYAAP